MSHGTRRLKRAFRKGGGSIVFFEGFKTYAACVAAGDITASYEGERGDAESWCNAKGRKP